MALRADENASLCIPEDLILLQDTWRRKKKTLDENQTRRKEKNLLYGAQRLETVPCSNSVQ